MRNSKKILLASSLFVASFAVNATIVNFDDEGTSTIPAGPNFEQATGANTGNPDVWGPSLFFSDFTVTGGYAASNVLTGSGFNISNITMTAIDQDSNGNYGGLGVCSESATCAGSSDSFSSNTNAGSNPGGDEILLFNFGAETALETVRFNGDHSATVNGDLDGTFKELTDALYNVFYSSDGISYSSIFGNAGQQQPTGLEYFDVSGNGSFSYWAVAASGWGDHSGYVEEIEYSKVPEPTILALFGLGLAGIGFSRRRNKK